MSSTVSNNINPMARPELLVAETPEVTSLTNARDHLIAPMARVAGFDTSRTVPMLEEPKFNPTNLDINQTVEAIKKLSIILHLLSVEERYSSRQTRWAEREQAIEAVKKQADALRSEAIKTLAAGILNGAITIAGGIMQGMAVRGAFGGNKGAAAVKADGAAANGANGTSATGKSSGFFKNLFGKGDKAAPNATDKAANAANATPEGNYLEAIQADTRGRVIGQTMQALGQLVAAPIQYSASLDRVLQKEIEADQKLYDYRVGDETDYMGTMMGVTKSAQSAMEEAIRTNNETIKAINSRV